MDFQIGDVVMSRHKSDKISRIIALFQKCGFSHTFVVIDKSAELCPPPYYICETSTLQLTVNNMDHYLDPKGGYEIEVWRKKGITHSEQLVVYDRATENLGKIYGYLQLLWNAVRVGFLRLFKIKVKMITKAGVTCVENTSYAYGVEDPEQYDLDMWYFGNLKKDFEMVYSTVGAK